MSDSKFEDAGSSPARGTNLTGEGPLARSSTSRVFESDHILYSGGEGKAQGIGNHRVKYAPVV